MRSHTAKPKDRGSPPAPTGTEGMAAWPPPYPVRIETISKADTALQSVDEIIAALGRHIVRNERMALVGIYDHYGETTRRGGVIAPQIQDAKEIVFCLCSPLDTPDTLTVYAYAIGVADLGNRFLVCLPAGDDPLTAEVIPGWIEALRE